MADVYDLSDEGLARVAIVLTSNQEVFGSLTFNDWAREFLTTFEEYWNDVGELSWRQRKSLRQILRSAQNQIERSESLGAWKQAWDAAWAEENPLNQGAFRLSGTEEQSSELKGNAMSNEYNSDVRELDAKQVKSIVESGGVPMGDITTVATREPEMVHVAVSTSLQGFVEQCDKMSSAFAEIRDKVRAGMTAEDFRNELSYAHPALEELRWSLSILFDVHGIEIPEEQKKAESDGE